MATLQQIEPVDGEVSVVVLCHTRELAYQIKNEYSRFSKYLPDVRTAVFYGGTPTQKDIDIIKDKSKCPHIIVATPGRLNALVRDKHLRLGNVKTFVIDECDKVLEATGKLIVVFFIFLKKKAAFLKSFANAYLFRYETRRPRNFPRYPSSKAGYDVFCNSFARDETHLQEVYAESFRNLC